MSLGLAAFALEVQHDPTVVDRFVADYLSLLDLRLNRITTNLAADDDAAAMVALLSLESTSAMIGAADLVSRVAHLRSAVTEQRRDDFEMATSSVVVAAEELRVRLHERTPPPAFPTAWTTPSGTPGA